MQKVSYIGNSRFTSTWILQMHVWIGYLYLSANTGLDLC